VNSISFESLALWCEESGYVLENWIPRLRSVEETLAIPVPGGPQALAELVDELVSFNEKQEEKIVWIRDWTIWNERSQEIGLCHLQLLATALRPAEQGTEGHIYRFESSEWSSVIAFLTVPILYGWDAHLFSRSGDALVDISHHGEVSVSLRADARPVGNRLLPWTSQARLG
jgi:hypothetical protein